MQSPTTKHPEPSAKQSWALPLALWFVCFALCLAVGLYLARFKILWSPDLGPRVAMIKEYLRTGSLLYLHYPYEEFDPTGRFFQLGSIYAVKVPKGFTTVYAPLFPWLSSFPYRWFGFAGFAFWPAFGAASTVVTTYLTLKELQLKVALLGAITILISTPLFLYGVVFWDHSLHYALCSLASLLLVRSFLRKRLVLAYLSGIVIGFGLLFHIIFLFVGAAIIGSVVFFLRYRLLRAVAVRMAIGIGFVGVLWAVFNQLAYGSPIGSHAMGDNSLSREENQRAMSQWSEVMPRTFSQLAGEHESTLRTVFLLSLVALLLLSLIRSRLWMMGALILVLSPIGALLIFATTWSMGLFSTSPLLLAALPFPRGEQTVSSEDESLILRRWLWVATLLFFLATLVQPRSPGLNWGNRYLLFSLPWLVVLAWTEIEWRMLAATSKISRVWLALAICATLIVGAIGNYGACVALRQTYRDRRRDFNTLNHLAPKILVTDFFWLASVLEAEDWAMPIIHVNSAHEPLGPSTRDLLAFLERAGIREFAFCGSFEREKLLIELANDHTSPCKFIKTARYPRYSYSFFQCIPYRPEQIPNTP